MQVSAIIRSARSRRILYVCFRNGFILHLFFAPWPLTKSAKPAFTYCDLRAPPVGRSFLNLPFWFIIHIISVRLISDHQERLVDYQEQSVWQRERPWTAGKDRYLWMDKQPEEIHIGLLAVTPCRILTLNWKQTKMTIWARDLSQLVSSNHQLW